MSSARAQFLTINFGHQEGAQRVASTAIFWPSGKEALEVAVQQRAGRDAEHADVPGEMQKRQTNDMGEDVGS